MARSARLAAFLLCLLWSAAAAAAAAAHPEPTPTTAAKRAAHKAFAAGERAFKNGDYTTALADFRQAFAHVSHDAVRFNIAVCLARLGRYSEAAEQYEAAATSSMLDDKERERARKAAAETRKKLGQLAVRGGVAGVGVRVNGAQRCTVPCQLDLDPGSYNVAVADKRVTVQIESGAQQVVQVPAPAPAPAPRKTPPPPAKHRVKPVKPRASLHARGPGWLTWTGGAIAVVGGAGTTYFGLRTQKLHNDYTREPTQQRLDDGRTSRLLTNVSIGVIAAGAALVTVDLLFIAPTGHSAERVSDAWAGRVRF